jgi:hypothetical protein
MHRRTRHEREQLELFRALPGDLAPGDAQDLMAYPFFSLAKTHRTTPIDFRMNEIAIRVEAVPEHGMATIWDADVLIWAASQIVEARDAGLRTSRLMVTTPREILTFTRRGTGARDYHRLKAALDRLQSPAMRCSATISVQLLLLPGQFAWRSQRPRRLGAGAARAPSFGSASRRDCCSTAALLMPNLSSQRRGSSAPMRSTDAALGASSNPTHATRSRCAAKCSPKEPGLESAPGSGPVWIVTASTRRAH